MATAIATMHHDFALDIYGLLRELDPSHWTEGEDAPFRAQLEAVRTRLREVVQTTESHEATPALDAIRTGLIELRRIMDSHDPQPGMVDAWQEFRATVAPVYERYAASLRHLDIHVPSLRPTNYARNVFHACNSTIAMGLLLMLTERQVLGAAAFMMCLAWSLELGRRISPGLNTFLMRLLGRLAHPHEAWRVNSATWFCTASFVVACTWDLEAATVGMVVLGFADPAAAIVGRRFGRVQLVNGRTLLGSAAFFAVGTVCAFAWLCLAWSAVPLVAFKMAAAGALAGTLAELFSRRIDDNLSIPVAAALAALAV